MKILSEMYYGLLPKMDLIADFMASKHGMRNLGKGMYIDRVDGLHFCLLTCNPKHIYSKEYLLTSTF